MDPWKIIVDVLTAVGTIAVAIVAIWGEKVRALLSPPKLVIRLHTPRGSPTTLTVSGVVDPSGGTRVMYYHLKVVNVRPWIAVHNCRVLLKGIGRRRPDGSFHPIHFPVPLQFIWPNEGDAPARVVVTKESILDFGRIAENSNQFYPLLYVYANNFDGFVRKGETIRYSLEIDASNFVSERPQIFEVAWDGVWCFESENMEQHLTIKEVTDP